MTEHIEKTTYKPRIWAFLLLLVGIAVLIGSLVTVMNWVANKPKRPVRPTVVELPFVETQAVILSQNRVKVSTGGFVSAKTTANITPQVSGKVMSVSPHLFVGKSMKKGEIMAQLGMTNYTVALSSAQATLATANASYINSQANHVSANAKLASAKANLASAQSTYEQTKAQSRQAKHDIQLLSLQETNLNMKKPQLAAAKAAVDNAQAGIASAKAGINNAKANIASAKAAIDSATAQVKLAKTNLARTTIKAPFNALVKEAKIAVGEVANNGKILATLVATDVYTVKLTLSSQSVKFISLGDNVMLIDNVSGNRYQALLSRFAPNIDAKNRTLAVYVDINNPLSGKKPLFLESYLDAEITGLIVPNSAIITSSAIINNAYVWHKKSDNSIAKVPVNVVNRTGKTALVVFQTPIAELITRPKDSFVDGQKVTTSREVKKRPKRRKNGNGKSGKREGKPTSRPKTPATGGE